VVVKKKITKRANSLIGVAQKGRPEILSYVCKFFYQACGVSEYSNSWKIVHRRMCGTAEYFTNALCVAKSEMIEVGAWRAAPLFFTLALTSRFLYY
jgi:hypothetical protein